MDGSRWKLVLWKDPFGVLDHLELIQVSSIGYKPEVAEMSASRIISDTLGDLKCYHILKIGDNA